MGWVAKGDYRQLEARTLALASGDEKLMYWLLNDIDIHVETAKFFFKDDTLNKASPEREMMKTPRYAAHYGVSAETLHAQMVIDYPDVTMVDAKRFIDTIYHLHPGIKRHNDNKLREAYRKGYVSSTISGRKHHFPGGKRFVEPAKVYNLPNQMDGAAIMDLGEEAVFNELNHDETILAQVHDALWLEGDDPFHLYYLLKHKMKQQLTVNGHAFCFDTDVEIGKDFEHMEKVKNEEHLKEIIENWASIYQRLLKNGH